MDLQAGHVQLQGPIAIGGQTIPITVKTEIKERMALWIVTETAVTPQGEISDVSTIEKGSSAAEAPVDQAGANGDRARRKRK